MALFQCPECGNELSNKSTICPNCGYLLKHPKSKIKKLCFILALLLIIIICFLFYKNKFRVKESLVNEQNKEPIIGEWEFVLLKTEDSDFIITSDLLDRLGFENNAEIFFKANETAYVLSLFEGEHIMTNSWKKNTSEAFTDKYAYTYNLDEENKAHAIIESENDLNTLRIFMRGNNGTTLLEFARIEN